jgi:hypothetical protein
MRSHAQVSGLLRYQGPKRTDVLVPALVLPGELLRIPEAHYLYGRGELVLRVTRTGAAVALTDGDWLAVTGIPVAWNGTDLPEREVLLRVAYLQRHRQD